MIIIKKNRKTHLSCWEGREKSFHTRVFSNYSTKAVENRENSFVNYKTRRRNSARFYIIFPSSLCHALNIRLEREKEGVAALCCKFHDQRNLRNFSFFALIPSLSTQQVAHLKWYEESAESSVRGGWMGGESRRFSCCN